MRRTRTTVGDCLYSEDELTGRDEDIQVRSTAKRRREGVQPPEGQSAHAEAESDEQTWPEGQWTEDEGGPQCDAEKLAAEERRSAPSGVGRWTARPGLTLSREFGVDREAEPPRKRSRGASEGCNASSSQKGREGEDHDPFPGVHVGESRLPAPRERGEDSSSHLLPPRTPSARAMNYIRALDIARRADRAIPAVGAPTFPEEALRVAVSYTHLTLPTIYSV